MKLKTLKTKHNIGQICAAYGYSRQAYYKRNKHEKELAKVETEVLEIVYEIRQKQPLCGGRKLKKMLMKRFNLEIGRDKLFEILRRRGLLVKKKKNYVRTTNSFHHFHKYKNLIKDININKVKPGEIIVTDITYILTTEGYKYLSLVTDIGSRKIIGYYYSDNLAAEGPVKALKMALKELKKLGIKFKKIIHHSDRGIQYCCKEYVKILKKNKIKISMTEENHCYENAIAERVNGILKGEFLLGEILNSKLAAKMIKEAIEIYNTERLHMSLNYETPLEVFKRKVA